MNKNNNLSLHNNPIQTIYENTIYLPNSIGNLIEKNSAFLYPDKELTKKTLNYLLNSFKSPDKYTHINHFSFHI
jgi:hypothetical protein